MSSVARVILYEGIRAEAAVGLFLCFNLDLDISSVLQVAAAGGARSGQSLRCHSMERFKGRIKFPNALRKSHDGDDEYCVHDPL